MNGFAEYEVLKGLKLKVSAGYTYDSRKQDQFNNSNTRYGGPTSTDKVNAQVTRQERLTWLNENTLTYQTNIKKKHFLNVLGGITFQNSDYEIYSFRTTHIPNESLGMAGMSEGQAGTTTSAKSSWAMLSYLGRVTYNYMSKYYTTVSFRRFFQVQQGQPLRILPFRFSCMELLGRRIYEAVEKCTVQR